jgi:hypothetical protein
MEEWWARRRVVEEVHLDSSCTTRSGGHGRIVERRGPRAHGCANRERREVEPSESKPVHNSAKGGCMCPSALLSTIRRQSGALQLQGEARLARGCGNAGWMPHGREGCAWQSRLQSRMPHGRGGYAMPCGRDARWRVLPGLRVRRTAQGCTRRTARGIAEREPCTHRRRSVGARVGPDQCGPERGGAEGEAVGRRGHVPVQQRSHVRPGPVPRRARQRLPGTCPIHQASLRGSIVRQQAASSGLFRADSWGQPTADATRRQPCPNRYCANRQSSPRALRLGCSGSCCVEHGSSWNLHDPRHGTSWPLARQTASVLGQLLRQTMRRNQRARLLRRYCVRQCTQAAARA